MVNKRHYCINGVIVHTVNEQRLGGSWLHFIFG